MSNRIETDLLSLSEAARTLPGRPSPSTLWRWRSRGIGGVRLQTVMVGGRRYVSRAALEQFVRELTIAREPRHDQLVERSAEITQQLEAAQLLRRP